EQRLRRDAADVDAGAAGRAALYQENPTTKVTRPDRGREGRRSGADHDQVEVAPSPLGVGWGFGEAAQPHDPVSRALEGAGKLLLAQASIELGPTGPPIDVDLARPGALEGVRHVASAVVAGHSGDPNLKPLCHGLLLSAGLVS